MVEPEIHENTFVNSEITQIDEENQSRDPIIDDERLLKTRPRNIFPSYSNVDVSVRFRVSFIAFIKMS